jgi:hypothetical protein
MLIADLSQQNTSSAEVGAHEIIIQWHKCWKVLQSGLRIQSCITGEKESTKGMMRQNLAIL